MAQAEVYIDKYIAMVRTDENSEFAPFLSGGTVETKDDADDMLNAVKTNYGNENYEIYRKVSVDKSDTLTPTP